MEMTFGEEQKLEKQFLDFNRILALEKLKILIDVWPLN